MSDNEMFSREAIYEMIKNARAIKPMAEALGWQVSDILAKSVEELGEFSTACLIKQGKIRNKTLEHADQPFDEAADVMICLLDAITRLYPDMPASEVYILFLCYVDKKRAKWVDKVMEEHKEHIVHGPE